MILILIAAVAASLTVFVAIGALTGQFAYSHRRMASRMVTLDRHASDANGSAKPVTILRESSLARGRWLGTFLEKFTWAGDQARLLDRANLPIRVSEYLLILGVAAIGVGLLTALTSGIPLVGVLFGGVTALAIELWLRSRARRRLHKFESQLPQALEVMSTSLKSGFGILEALSTVARELDEPLAGEFRRVIEETRVGGSFENGLRDMLDRMGSQDLRIVVRAMEVHRRVGGNLGEVLDSVASTMREREELRGHIRALAAQQRLSIIIVALIPAWSVGFFLITDPDFVSPLWEDSVGRVLLAIASGLELFSIVLMRRLTAIEV